MRMEGAGGLLNRRYHHCLTQHRVRVKGEGGTQQEQQQQHHPPPSPTQCFLLRRRKNLVVQICLEV
ncbi:hypothetical protein E2C01_063478 [Portunus trituberculatus]|uniref:Uncharacterized protein n=1 Tax=Portunus trituberculatus TaxID=210409 RepID=A0A5B7H996_PORTR|nr:hypothetical protein [Portunus trituberculatus]